MRSVEAEGSSIDEAIANALKALDVARDRVQIEIVNSASRGFLGLGGRKARVRATVRAPLTIGLRDSAESGGESQVEERAPVETAEARGEPRESGGGEEAEALPRPRAGVAGQPAERARAVVGEILRLMGVDGEVSVAAGETEQGVQVEISGRASGLVIGRGGQTLDALEYLVNRMLARGDEGTAGRVSLDAEHYRERRRRALQELATRVAERARRKGRPITLNPMSPRDRREVHLALQDQSGLATRSQGQGYYRKLVVVPVAGDSGRRGGRSGGAPGEG